MFLAITSSTVCALAVIEKNAMAISKGRKKRIIRENFLTEVSRNSTFMNSPNPTVGDNTPTERTKTANLYYSDEISSTGGHQSGKDLLRGQAPDRPALRR